MTLGHIGRKVALNDPEVTFSMTENLDEASGGWKVTVTWDGPSDRVFEDCYGFSKCRYSLTKLQQNGLAVTTYICNM